MLQLFVQQALSVRDQIAQADHAERLRLAHGLKGSARSIGAFAIADCVAEIEKRPADRQLLKTLLSLIEKSAISSPRLPLTHSPRASPRRRPQGLAGAGG